MTTKTKTKTKATPDRKRGTGFGVYIPDMGVAPRVVKPSFTPPVKTPAPDTSAPGGRYTYSDVVETLRAVRNACGKEQALALLASAGSASVRDPEPRCYDALVESCEQFELVPRMPYGLHFALRALESILKGDPVLVQHATLAAATDHYQSHLALVHEEGRRAATILLGVAKGAFTTGYPLLDSPPIFTAMQGHLRAVERALKPTGYNWERRREAAAHTRAAIELWSVAVAAR